MEAGEDVKEGQLLAAPAGPAEALGATQAGATPGGAPGEAPGAPPAGGPAPGAAAAAGAAGGSAAGATAAAGGNPVAADDPAAAGSPSAGSKVPTVVIVIGMAGSGKTTMVRALHAHLSKAAVASDAEGTYRPPRKVYTLNLDPAVLNTGYPINIDIRNTVKYKKVMQQYGLGPNGAILTCLNLFASKFDQVLNILSKRAPSLDYVLVDTPGQIEAFNWSASGSIVLDSLAVSFPTLILYVVDTVRCKSPVSFMSNMTYACSVMYKSKLPFLLAFNKTDAADPEQCRRWMKDYGAFADDAMHEDSYMASLSRSCALAMNEFYEGIRTASVSAGKQLGFVPLEGELAAARAEYTREYLPWLAAQREAVQQRRAKFAAEEAARFRSDRRADGAEEGLTPEEAAEERRLLAELRAKHRPAA